MGNSPIVINKDNSALMKLKRLTRRVVRWVLLKIPAIDTISVVRCKDCEWCEDAPELDHMKFCFRLMNQNEKLGRIRYKVDEDAFCSYGKRRKNNGI